MMDQTLEATPSSTASAQTPVQLRWEWRTFGRTFGAAEKRIAKLEPSAPKESDEIYFLSDGGENVKVRDGLMDVKVLREVNSDGLQQWAPVMKAEFPLSPADTDKVVEALRIPQLAASHESCSLEAFLAALNDPASGVRVVNVHKRRVRYTIEGCMAELSDITANGMSVRTVAVESVDAEAIMRAVDAIGLTGYTNTSYLKGLADLIDHSPERYAVIDVGTNSIKFHVGERLATGGWSAVTDRAELTRLGEGLAETGRISDAALDRTASAIDAMAADAKRNGVRAIAAVGTAGLRIASNAAEVLAEIRKRTGVQIEVVSGEEEARLAYRATTAALGPMSGSIVVFDTGGGSSQFTFGQGGDVDERFSVDVGAARYTEQFGLDAVVSERVVSEAMTTIAKDLSRLDNRETPDALVGMGGVLTNIAAVSLDMAEYDPDRIQGATVTAEEIDRQIELYRSRSADQRRRITGLQPKRSEVILAGACIVRTILRKLGKDQLTVSDRGLRHGLLAARFGA